MIYGYIRVSTDKQTVENQRFEIIKFCKREKITINKWIEETISGTTTVDKRKLGQLLKTLKKNDIIICSEISRLGRNLISQRTKEALALKKNGTILGRPKGRKSSRLKLSGQEQNIRCMYKEGLCITQIAQKLNVRYNTLKHFIKSLNLLEE